MLHERRAVSARILEPVNPVSGVCGRDEFLVRIRVEVAAVTPRAPPRSAEITRSEKVGGWVPLFSYQRTVLSFRDAEECRDSVP